jgi:uridine kinase
MKRYLVGIAGPSCSGKSLLARQLAITYAERSSHVLSLDCYYRDLSDLDPEEREKRNFDVPEAIDVELFIEHLRTLLTGGEIEAPVYDFATHTRAPHTHKVAAAELLIVEGLFALHWEVLRGILQSRIFVNIPEDMLLARRLERDVRQRGRSPEQVLAQYHETVKPMNERYVLPTSAFADFVVSGIEPVEKLIATIRANIDQYFGSGPEAMDTDHAEEKMQ